MLLFHTTSAAAYHIGTKGAAWGAAEKAQWLAERTIKRSYADEVLAKLDALRTASHCAFSAAPQAAPLVPMW